MQFSGFMSLTTMHRSTTTLCVRHRPIVLIPTGTGNGITENGAGSLEFDPGGTLLDGCRRDEAPEQREELGQVDNAPWNSRKGGG